MNIVLDTLGGDNPPEEIIRGGLKAAAAFGIAITFAGDGELIRTHLPNGDERFSVLHAPEAISMEDTPAEAVRRKKNSSLVQGIKRVRHGEGDAFVSPANTGAVMAASLFGLGRIQGIERPGIAALLPTTTGKPVLVIDVGANTNCDSDNLFQFAIMGRAYARQVLAVAEPKVALVNIGTEAHKGDELIRRTRPRLEEGLPGFAGYVEPNRLLRGDVDVAVCDGFVGNILLKSLEGGAAAAVKFLQNGIQSNWVARFGALFLLPTLRGFRQELSASRYGGAVLLGVRGISVIAHGDSDAEAIKNAIGVAHSAVEHDLVQRIEDGLHRYFSEEVPAEQRA